MFRRLFGGKGPTRSAPGSGAGSPTRPGGGSGDEHGQGQGASQQQQQQLQRLHTMFRSTSLPSSSTQSLRGMPSSSSTPSFRGLPAANANVYATIRGPRPSGNEHRAGLQRARTTV